jgi:transposase
VVLLAARVDRASPIRRLCLVKAVVAPDRKMDTLRPLIRKHVAQKTTVVTDDFTSYDGLNIRGWNHQRINHSAGFYVKGDVHTQTIEGFWSHVKNGIRGVYKAVGREYLQSYLNEYCFRYSHRRDTKPMFFSFLEQVRKEPLALPAPSLEESPF